MSESEEMRLLQLSRKAIDGARSVVPQWQSRTTEEFYCKSITGGLTNVLNLVGIGKFDPSQQDSVSSSAKEEEEERKKVLVRIFGEGTDEFINRKVEGLVCEVMSDTGIAPNVYGVFPGGRAEEFIDNATSVLNKDLHNADVLKQVAQLMAKMHSIDLSRKEFISHQEEFKTPATPGMLWTLWNFACRAKFEKNASKALKLAALQVGLLAHEIEWLGKELEQSGMGKVLCHRDLQSGNVMVRKNAQGEIGKVYLIDFEYSGVDYCAFDYGNSFCEMSINNFCPNFPGFVLDPAMYPTKKQQEFFFSHYLDSIPDPSRLFPVPIETKEKQIEKLCQYAQLGSLASHLQWALWGIVQAEHSSIEFGYLEYATSRIDQYYAHRDAYKKERF